MSNDISKFHDDLSVRYLRDGDKSFTYDHIIEKFFKDHHDKEGLNELKIWRKWSKQDSFKYDSFSLIYHKFLQRRKQILDSQFEWTPANKERFVFFNRQIYKTELDLYNNLKVIKKKFSELLKGGHFFLEDYYTISGIYYLGYYIEGEDFGFDELLKIAYPTSFHTKFVRNAFFDYRSKLEKPTRDWGYEFNESQKECASIEAFQKLPLHKHAGFLIFDSQIFALQDIVNMYIHFEAVTKIYYDNSHF